MKMFHHTEIRRIDKNTTAEGTDPETLLFILEDAAYLYIFYIMSRNMTCNICLIHPCTGSNPYHMISVLIDGTHIRIGLIFRENLPESLLTFIVIAHASGKQSEP